MQPRDTWSSSCVKTSVIGEIVLPMSADSIGGLSYSSLHCLCICLPKAASTGLCSAKWSKRPSPGLISNFPNLISRMTRVLICQCHFGGPSLPTGLPLFTQVCIRIRTLEMQTFQMMLEVSEYPGSSLLIDLDMTLPLIYTKIPLVFPMAQLTLSIHIKAQTPLGVSH